MADTLTKQQWIELTRFEQSLQSLEDWLAKFSTDDPVRQIVLDKIEELFNKYKTK